MTDAEMAHYEQPGRPRSDVGWGEHVSHVLTADTAVITSYALEVATLFVVV